MKSITANRASLLSCCLLVLVQSSAAQAGLSATMNQTSQTTSLTMKAGPVDSRLEPVTLPAGTHLLMKLVSSLHTTSSTPGSGVYLETVFPVVQNDRVVIPEHTRV